MGGYVDDRLHEVAQAEIENRIRGVIKQASAGRGVFKYVDNVRDVVVGALSNILKEQEAVTHLDDRA